MANGPGQPTKLTEATLQEAGRLSAIGCSITTIAQSLGVDRGTIYNWLKKGEASETDLHVRFFNVIHSSAGSVEARCLSALDRAVRSEEARDSTPAAQWMLTHHPKLRERWSDAAATRRELDRLLAAVAQGVANSGLTPEQQQQVVLSMQAAGAGVPNASDH